MSANISQAIPVTMKSFKLLLGSVSPDTAVCVRGRHAVGKSEGVYQAASEMRCEEYKDPEFCARMIKAFGGAQNAGVKHADGTRKMVWTYEDGIPVMERRLSQMTEGDTIGLPFKSDHGTMFAACDWLVLTCEFPALLFLDERNRALDGVKQSVFQLCDSKAFYGNTLHTQTRVVIAENVGEEYQVQACDPAEVSRTATVVLEPTEEDWLKYAAGRCHQATIEFIRTNKGKLEHNGIFEPNKKYPDRRSWFKLDAELQKLDLFDEPEKHLFYVLAGSFLGPEVGQLFTAFCKDRDRQVSAKDVLKSWKKSKKRLAGDSTVSAESYVEVVSKLTDLLKDYKINSKEAEQIAAFMHDCPPEVVMVAWSALQVNVDNLFQVHPFIEKLMVSSARCKETGEIKQPTAEEVEQAAAAPKGKKKAAATTTSQAIPAPKQRGAKNRKRR